MQKVTTMAVVISGSLLTLIVPAGFAVSADLGAAAMAASEPQVEYAAPASDDTSEDKQANAQILSLKTPFSGVPVGVTARLAAELTQSQAADYQAAAQSANGELAVMDWSGSNAIISVLAGQAEQGFASPVTAQSDLSAEFQIAAPSEITGLDFDVGVVPRISVSRDGEFVSRRVGGEVRVGQRLANFTDSEKLPTGWYLFAGADGEALIWDNAESRGASGSMSMSDQLTVGDLQAGISMQRAGGQLSLSYIRREVKFDDRNRNIEETEDFAGISFTMRR
jgi:hypothetical protein